MKEMVEWCFMGGYAAYIWPAYGIVAVTLMLTVLAVKVQKKNSRNQLTQWFKS